MSLFDHCPVQALLLQSPRLTVTIGGLVIVPVL